MVVANDECQPSSLTCKALTRRSKQDDEEHNEDD
jgi:hypothetical protein